MSSKVEIIGNVGKDPVIKQTSTGWTIVSFSIADNKLMSGVKKTMWFDVKFITKDLDSILFCAKKGNFVVVTGRLDIEEWQSQDGVQKKKVVIIGNKIENKIFIKKDKEQKSVEQEDKFKEPKDIIIDEDENLPF